MAPPPVKTVGYIGLGKAGSSMASNLPKAGFNLIVRDSDPAREQKFARENRNTRIAERNPDAFREADVIITMLPNGKIVREVLLGQGGFAPALRPGTIIVDTSSSSPYDTRSLGAELAKRKLTLIDSPITQTHMHATDTGDATLMVGCNSQEAFDRVLPILPAMAKYTFHMGELGAGYAMKTLNNYIMASGYTALADSLVVGQKFSLDPIQMIDVLNVGTGSNFPAKDTFKNDALPRTYASGFQLALLIKDLGITKELMENVGFRTLLPGLIQEGLKHAMGKVSGPDADHTEGLKGWEDRAGIKLRTGRPEGKTVTAIKSKL